MAGRTLASADLALTSGTQTQPVTGDAVDVRARLPTDIEWQRAAQGDDGRRWPWGMAYDPARCNSDSSGATPVANLLAMYDPARRVRAGDSVSGSRSA